MFGVEGSDYTVIGRDNGALFWRPLVKKLQFAIYNVRRNNWRPQYVIITQNNVFWRFSQFYARMKFRKQSVSRIFVAIYNVVLLFLLLVFSVCVFFEWRNKWLRDGHRSLSLITARIANCRSTLNVKLKPIQKRAFLSNFTKGKCKPRQKRGQLVCCSKIFAQVCTS